MKFGGEGFKAHGHDDFEAEERDMIERESPIEFGKRWEMEDDDEAE